MAAIEEEKKEFEMSNATKDKNLSADELDSDDLDGDLNLSDEEQDVREQLRQLGNAEERKDREVQVVEFDTNIFKVSLNCLQDRGQLATGDATFCSCCHAVFNQSSVIMQEGDQQIWICEFCNHRNEVNIGEEELPQSMELTYLLEAPAQVQQAEEAKVNQSDQISVVFCIDISSSMSSGMRLEQCKQAIAAQINAMAESNPDRKIGLITFE